MTARGEVPRVLSRSDPLLGLITPGAPADGYGPEAGTIPPRLDEADPVEGMRRIVRKEFVRRFSEKVAGPESAYEAVARGPVWAARREEGDRGR